MEKIDDLPDSEWFDHIDFLLSSAQTASCTCLTKTGNIAYHDSDCKYRILVEAQTWLRKIRTRHEAEMGKTYTPVPWWKSKAFWRGVLSVWTFGASNHWVWKD